MSTVQRDGQAAQVVVLHDAQSVEGFEAALQDAAFVQTLRRVAATMIHDFKSPLQSALWAVDLLERSTASESATEQRVAYLATLKKEIARLKSASETLLNGLAPAKPERIELVGLIEELARFVRAEAMLLQVELALALPGEEVIVQGRHSPLRTALLTLMLTALDALPEGGKLAIEIARERDWVALSIVETGSHTDGTPDRSFELNFSVENAPCGIGLYVARSVVRAHGGEIDWSASPEGGSTFRIKLPAAS
jgi:two-component system sensor histidine kinase HydH